MTENHSDPSHDSDHHAGSENAKLVLTELDVTADAVVTDLASAGSLHDHGVSAAVGGAGQPGESRPDRA